MYYVFIEKSENTKKTQIKRKINAMDSVKENEGPKGMKTLQMLKKFKTIINRCRN